MSKSVFFNVMMYGLPAAAIPAQAVQASAVAEELEREVAGDVLRPGERLIAYESDGGVQMTPTPWIGVSIAARDTSPLASISVEPAEAAERFAARIGHMRSPAEMENYVGTDIERYEDPFLRIGYIDGAFRAFARVEDGLSFADRARMIHYFASRADECEIPLASERPAVLLTGLLQKLALAMDGVEVSQIELGPMSRIMALQAADVYHIYARKGEYLRYLLNAGKENRPFRDIRLAVTILRLRDVAKRYGNERDDAGLVSAIRLIEEMRISEVGLDRKEYVWAYNQLLRFIEINASEWALQRKAGKDADTISRSMRVFDRALSDYLRSLYLYSPFILRDAVRIFRTSGFGELASVLSSRAELYMERAVKLKLLPPGARHKLRLIP